MQGQSIFDPAVFMETTHKGNLDTKFVVPDEGDYMAQITDKLVIRSGVKDGIAWASLDVVWELLDEAVKQKLNMEHVYVRQSMFLDLDANNQLDLGVNRNMRLKRLWEATGVNKQKQVSIGALKFQAGYVHVGHRSAPDDPETIYAEVTKVWPVDKARQAA